MRSTHCMCVGRDDRGGGGGRGGGRDEEGYGGGGGGGGGIPYYIFVRCFENLFQLSLVSMLLSALIQ